MLLTVILVLAALIGLTLGAVGGGGSILAVPVLVGIVGLSVTEATTASLIVVGTAAVIGLLSDLHSGHVKVGPGLVFGLTGVGGAMLGTKLNRGLDESVLLIGFSILMAFVAVTMARKLFSGGAARQAQPAVAGPGSTERAEPAAQTGGGERGAASLARRVSTIGEPGTPVTTRRGRVRNCRIVAGVDTCQLVRLLAAGTAVGFLTGLFGVGGGFVIVPALVLLLGFDVRDAAATSLVVIAVNGAVALTLRADFGSVDWGVVAPFTAAATVGVLAGRRVAGRVPARALTIALTCLIAVMALWTAAQGLGIA